MTQPPPVDIRSPPVVPKGPSPYHGAARDGSKETPRKPNSQKPTRQKPCELPSAKPSPASAAARPASSAATSTLRYLEESASRLPNATERGQRKARAIHQIVAAMSPRSKSLRRGQPLIPRYVARLAFLCGGTLRQGK